MVRLMLSDFQILAADRRPWNSYLESASRVPVEATRSWIEYQTEYISETSSVKDRSLLLVDSAQPIALWPLCVIEHGDGSRTLTSYSGHVLEPIALVPRNSKVWQRAQTPLLIALRDLMEEESVNSARFVTVNGAGGSPSGFAIKMLSEDTTAVVNWEIVCDLSLTQKELWAAIRPSYRSIINRANELLEVEFITGLPGSIRTINELKRLHLEAAGRLTRGDLTWHRQLEAVQGGEAFIALAMKDGHPVGGSLVWCSRTEACYAVAAYNRKLMSEGLALGHFLQWKVIEYLRTKGGIDEYRLGTIPAGITRTQKEKSIDHFKMGFRTLIQPRPSFGLSASQRGSE